MRKLPLLYVVMLRYRVAAMVVLFMLLGATRGPGLDLAWTHALAAVALGSSYVSATALNDLADEAIDKVNHPRDAGRPLVEETASRRELSVLAVLAAALAVAAALPLGTAAVAVVLLSLLVSQMYSARPVRLSYRVAGAPLALAVAYVLVPYVLGIAAARGEVSAAFSRFTLALLLLFCARIVLKDFRDRVGDAQFGKPTLLLRYGKTATCGVSLCALAAADALLLTALAPAVALLAQPFVAAIAAMLWRLWRSDDSHAEQVAIGIGARMGNGLLLSLLAWLIVNDGGGSQVDALAVGATVAALFLVSFVGLLRAPGEVAIGYKG
ncbi:MAG: UbiA family prenyltransferase [Gaiellaceae bacterium]